MPYEFLPIGPAPCDEPCAQVGELGYDERSRRECRIFQRMLLRLFPIPESIPVSVKASVVVQTFPHDFGRYREVCVRFAPSNSVSAEWAYRVENNAPLVWDMLARNELNWLEQQADLQRAIESGELAPSDIPAIFRHGDIPALPVDAPCIFNAIGSMAAG